ncbi:hypothetical protein CA235_10070 [Sphingomonas sp. ABOLF]|uniref:hypothetical protein n=1 Tax=Sphingomonas sp. ABOLF TaxID=1985879 RepID=UPI000F7E466B|nr:hypothetical protein [Sphingomonas sp. ABOLF]RSV14863.1 hypothetical protein CA235_10070 [Sphingomonas sp. ABOLF]
MGNLVRFVKDDLGDGVWLCRCARRGPTQEASSGEHSESLNLKSNRLPGLNYPFTNHLERIIPEIKGADLRKAATRQGRNQRWHTVDSLDQPMAMLLHHD